MDLLERLRATPGVEAAGFARPRRIVGQCVGQQRSRWRAIRRRLGRAGRFAPELGAAPAISRRMGIPRADGPRLHRGRRSRRRQAPRRATIATKGIGWRSSPSRSRSASSHGHPIGRHIGMGGDPGTPTKIEIVGVVKDFGVHGRVKTLTGRPTSRILEQRDPSGRLVLRPHDVRIRSRCCRP